MTASQSYIGQISYNNENEIGLMGDEVELDEFEQDDEGDAFGEDNFEEDPKKNDWFECTDELREKLGKTIPFKEEEIFVSDFSNSTEIHEIEANISKLSSFKHFVRYVVSTRCGISSVKLTVVT